jgi:hypothetical protein
MNPSEVESSHRQSEVRILTHKIMSVKHHQVVKYQVYLNMWFNLIISLLLANTVIPVFMRDMLT